MCITLYITDLVIGLVKTPESNDYKMKLVGLGRLELPTSPLSGVRSNQAELQTHLRGSRILLEINYLRKAFTAQMIGPEMT